MPQSLVNEFNALANCELLIDPLAITGLSDGASITAITCQSATPATIGLPGGTKPVWKSNPYSYTGRPTIRLASVDATGLTVTGLTLGGNTGHTYIIVCRPDRINSANHRTLFGTSGNAPNVYCRQAVNRVSVFQGSERAFGTTPTSNPTSFGGSGGTFQMQNDWNILIVRASGTTTGWKCYLNGETHSLGKSSISDITTLYVGMLSGGTLAYGGDIGFVACYNRELSDGEVTAAAALLRAAFPLNPSPKGRPAFYIIGDSITHGNYATLNANRWSKLALDQATGIPADYRRAVEFAVPSAQVTGLEAAWNGSGGFKTWMPSDAERAIFLLFAGTNDIALGSQTGAATNTRLETFATTIKSHIATAKVYALTMLSRTGVTTVRTDFNTALLTNTASVTGILYSKTGSSLDGVIDVASLSPTIGGDGVHPANTGHGEIANGVDDALDRLFSDNDQAKEVTAVSLANANAPAGATTSLSATVTVSGGASQSTTWEVVSGSGSVNASTGAFDATGLSEGAAAVVRARSVFDPFYYDDATITVVAASTTPARLGGPLNRLAGLGR
jgi:lysophospholipase L1-like esterase